MAADFCRTDLSDQALKAWQKAHPELAPEQEKPLVEHKESPDKITASELRTEFALLHSEIAGLHAEIVVLRSGLQQAAVAAPALVQGAVRDFVATEIVL